MTNFDFTQIDYTQINGAVLPLVAIVANGFSGVISAISAGAKVANSSAERALSFIRNILLAHIIITMVRVWSKPLYLAGIIAMFMYFPDALQWIFMQIGLIELRIFAIILAVVMPEVFNYASGDVQSWADIFNSALAGLPTEMLQVMQNLQIAQLMGIVTSCLTSGFVIRTFLRMNKRMGL